MLSILSAEEIKLLVFKLNPNKAPGPDGLTSGSIHNYWTTKPKSSYSWLVNKLLKLKIIAYPLIHLRVQNGQAGRFWTDNWSPYECLETFLDASTSRLGIASTATIASLFRNGSWRIPSARSDAQLQLLAFLTTISLNTNSDYYEWEINGKSRLKFSTGEVYHYLRGPVTDVQWASVVWPSRGIPRQSFHCWLVTKDRLPTRDRILRWGIQIAPLCLLCNAAPESRNHLFWDCNFSFSLWHQVAARCNLFAPQRDCDGSLAQMISLSSPRPLRLLTILAWQATLYWLWNERNTRLHANTFRSIDSLFNQIDRQLRNKTQSFKESNPTLSSSMLQLWLA
ncbi:hypothetical protein Bca101_083316 [Brassica carinata]